MKLIYPKIEAYTSRFALWLHCVNAVLADELPEQYITAKTMARAIHLASFFLEQAKLLYTVDSPQKGLEGRLLKVYNYVQNKKNGINLRQAKQNISIYNKSKISSKEIKQDFDFLLTQGYLKQEGEIYFPVVGSLLVPLTTVETVTQQEFQPIVGIVGSIGEIGEIGEIADPGTTEELELAKTTNNDNKMAETLTSNSVEPVGDTTNNYQQLPTTGAEILLQENGSSQPLTDFQVGDAVTCSQPYLDLTGKHGTVTKIVGSKITVQWEERKGKGNEFVIFDSSDLKKL